MKQQTETETQNQDSDFSYRLLLLIKTLGISQNQFSKRIGSNSAYLSNLVTGKSKPGMEFLQKIALQFSVSLDWLILGKGTMFGSLALDNNLHHAIFLRMLLAKNYVHGNEQARLLVEKLFAGERLTLPRIDGNVIDISEQMDKRDLLDDMDIESNIGHGLVSIYNQVQYEEDNPERNVKILILALDFYNADNSDPLAVLVCNSNQKY